MKKEVFKVGIVTLNGYYNYGNRLQNYALQEFINILGFEVETILLEMPKNNTSKITLGKLRKVTFKKIHNRIVNKASKYFNEELLLDRKDVFIKFTSDYIKETDFLVSENNVPSKIYSRYKYFISGSDQVWNPHNQNGTSLYFLTFAEKKKRISYAASFAISELPIDYVEDYRVWLTEMEKLSVREEDGASIIKELTGRYAPVHVDPTLLLSKDKWLSIAKRSSNRPAGKYLLTYFLGGVPKGYKKQIKNIAKENKLKVINLGDIREKDTYRTGPSEFIDYVNSCSVFCTDSFHGAVFSILFEKPFIVYERMGTSASMFSRIETLLNTFNLEGRKAENIKSNEDVFNIDYSHIPSILERERNKSFDYLKEALNITNEA